MLYCNWQFQYRDIEHCDINFCNKVKEDKCSALAEGGGARGETDWVYMSRVNLLGPDRL